MSATAARPPDAAAGSTRRIRYLAVGAGFVLLLILLQLAPIPANDFPAAWDVHLSERIDGVQAWVIGARSTHPLFLYVIDPLRHGIDGALRIVEGALLAIPWPAFLVIVFFIVNRAQDRVSALLAVVGLFLIGLTGLWGATMQTLALMGVSVLLALALGIPLGILTARSDRLHRFVRPLLDAMQTMPAFVYLIPVVLFFGVARVPGVIATVIYALPPAIRLTDMGIRQVPVNALEAADVFGTTAWQKLRKVQLPLAMPSILVGINQTIMMALGIVVIAALIGAPGLGQEVYAALGRQQVGRGLEAGLAIVFIAVILDRISYGFSTSSDSALRSRQAHTDQRPVNRINALSYWGMALILVLLLLILDAFVIDLSTFPASWRLTIAEPVDQAVRWMRDHLYQIGDLPLGTGPFSDFITLYLLNPLRTLLQDWLPWPFVMALGTWACYVAGGWGLACFSAASLLLIGLMGLWDASMDTLSQVLVAAALAVLTGIPLGIWAARSDRVRALLRPILDLLQTIPIFVFLVPVIMLFNVGRVPGIIASVLYAIPPVIRLTDLGIRGVPVASVEAAAMFGVTPAQMLRKVQLPLARPTIMLGINQTIMMVLAMVVVAGLVGGGALGLETVTGLAKSQVGRGMEAGLAIVILAIILDRLTQAMARQDLSTERI